MSQPLPIAGYQIERVLGRGGMGVVYAVRRQGTPGVYALKTLEAEAPERARKRFAREIQLLRQVNHPHVLGLLDAGEAPDGRVYLVTELVPGQTLREICKDAPLPTQRTLEVMQALSGAVQALHAQGIIHRDLKPDNVILRPDGCPVLLDFGIARADEVARLTKTGEVLGTPAFMSPEQVDGQGVDERSDVYGLGSILYYLLTGHPPFDAQTAFALYRQVLFEDPEWPTADGAPATQHPDQTAWSLSDESAPPPAAPLRAGLCEVVRRAMAKELDARYARVAELKAALETLARGEAVARAPRRGGRGKLVAAAAVLLLVGALGAWATWGRDAGPSGPDAVDMADARPVWGGAFDELPPLADPGFDAALREVKPQTAGEEAAAARLGQVSKAFGALGTQSEADLDTWVRSVKDLPRGLLGPLNLLREPSVTVFHHGSHMDAPQNVRAVDQHLIRNSVWVAFCDEAGSRYVTLGHRELKVWTWPDTLEATLPLPTTWKFSQCVIADPATERVFFGGRLMVPDEDDPDDETRQGGLGVYRLSAKQVEISPQVATTIDGNRVQALTVHKDVLVAGNNKGVVAQASLVGSFGISGRGSVPEEVNVRGIAFLEETDSFYVATGDDSDELSGLYRFRPTFQGCSIDERFEERLPKSSRHAFTCLVGCPPYGLFAGRSDEGVVAAYSMQGRGDVLVDPRTGRAHARSVVALAAARERGWLVSVSGWSEWGLQDADDIIESGRLPGQPATLCVWDLKSGALLGRYARLHEIDGFTGVAVTPDGSRVIASTNFGDVLAWEFE